jgi:uncharacterized protein YndB with AHSA1/START domain
MDVRAEMPDEATVALEVRLDMPPTEAFRAFTDAAALEQWFWPPRLQPQYTVDPRPGGVFAARSDVADIALAARFRELNPPDSLKLDWAWAGEDGAPPSIVTLTFATDGEGTRLTVVHSANDSAETRDRHAQGWTDCLARLLEMPAES